MTKNPFEHIHIHTFYCDGNQGTLEQVVVWDVIEAYFNHGGGAEAMSPLAQHQLGSYNDFIDRKLGQIIHGSAPVVSTFHIVGNPAYDRTTDAAAVQMRRVRRVRRTLLYNMNGPHRRRRVTWLRITWLRRVTWRRIGSWVENAHAVDG